MRNSLAVVKHYARIRQVTVIGPDWQSLRFRQCDHMNIGPDPSIQRTPQARTLCNLPLDEAVPKEDSIAAAPTQ